MGKCFLIIIIFFLFLSCSYQKAEVEKYNEWDCVNYTPCKFTGGVTNEGVKCIADNICQKSCAKDPDCAVTGTGTGTGTGTATGAGTSEANSIKENCSDGECLITKGSFKMGSPSSEAGRSSNETQHDVTITYDFYMGQTEVTQGEWKAIYGSANNPSNFSSCGDNCPVEQVAFWDVLNYANEKSKKAGLQECYDLSGCSGAIKNGSSKSTYSCGDNSPLINPIMDFDGNGKKEIKDLLKCPGYRLPTEAEWEYAARAGTTTAFYNGAINETGRDPNKIDLNLTKIAWYGANSNATYSKAYDCSSWLGSGKKCGPHPVKGKIKNAFGLYDMSGNALEWVFDWYGSYQSGPLVDPTGASGGSDRVRRGGSWNGLAKYCRSAARITNSYRSSNLGFRLARSLRP